MRVNEFWILARANQNTPDLNEKLGNNNVILRFGGISELKKNVRYFLKLNIYSFGFPFSRKFPSFFWGFGSGFFPNFPKTAKKWCLTRSSEITKNLFWLENRLESSVKSSECRALLKTTASHTQHSKKWIKNRAHIPKFIIEFLIEFWVGMIILSKIKIWLWHNNFVTLEFFWNFYSSKN